MDRIGIGSADGFLPRAVVNNASHRTGETTTGGYISLAPPRTSEPGDGDGDGGGRWLVVHGDQRRPVVGYDGVGPGTRLREACSVRGAPAGDLLAGGVVSCGGGRRGGARVYEAAGGQRRRRAACVGCVALWVYRD